MKNLSIVVLVLALSVLGCRMPSIFESANSNSGGTTGETDGSRAATAENPEVAPTANAREDVIRMSKKFLDQPYFSATMSGEGETQLNMAIDYQAPDRFHMTYRQPGGQMQNETIIIGRDMYMKAGQNWQKMPGALGKTVPQIREFFDEKGLESLRDVNYIGEETVDGERAYVYSYRNEAKKEEAPYPFTSKIWVRASDGLPARIQVDYEGGQLKTMSIVYDYEKKVSIEPPTTR